jgi:DNA-binding GntR family transcriptional regulator
MKAKGFNRWKAPVELLSNGHDSILAECDEEDADRAAELLQNSMTQTVHDEDGTMMTYSAEAHVSPRWSRA